MTILVVGAGEAATSVAGTLEGYHHPVQRCRTAAMAQPLLDHFVERYSLIMCEQGVDTEALMHQLASLERGTPVVVIGAPGSAEEVAAPAAAPTCSVERTADGCHQLRCALSEASARPSSHPGLAQALEERPVAFTYAAPVNQQR